MMRTMCCIIGGLATVIATLNAHDQKVERGHKQCRVIVFVHGVLKPKLALRNVLKVVRDRLDNTEYKHTLSIIRNDEAFFLHHAMQEPGLRPITIKDADKKNGAHALAALYDDISFANKSDTPERRYYTFGWSGLLSKKVRRSDAEPLYEELLAEIERLQRDGYKVSVRVIAYSHGGNVVLNLAAIARERSLGRRPLVIDELILLGMPVRRETDHLANDRMFKKIYHFYSNSDRIQNMDFLTLKQFFSKRTFNSRSTFTVPEKITQVRLRISRYMETQNEQNRSHSRRPRRKKVCSSSPGHTELWFFGWTPSWYRENFPLYPLPVVAFASHFIDCIDRTPGLHKDVVLELFPDSQQIIIRNRHRLPRGDSTFIFMPREEFERYQNRALAYKPIENLKTEQKERIREAIKRGRTFKREFKRAERIVRRKTKNAPLPDYYQIPQLTIARTEGTIPEENHPYPSAGLGVPGCDLEFWQDQPLFALNYFSGFVEGTQNRL